MALVYTINQSNTAFNIMMALKDELVSAGWAVKASGRGTSRGYSAAGDLWTLPMNTTNYGYYGWIRLQHPDEVVVGSGQYREMLWQYASTYYANKYWVYYSYAGFTGGTPDEDTRPTASDEQRIWGTSPASDSPLFDNTTSLNTYHIIAEDVSPYRFYFWSSLTSKGWPETSMFWDTVKAGTYPAADIDPFIYNAYYNATNLYVYDINLRYVAGHSYCWHGKDAIGTGTFGPVQAAGYQGDDIVWPASTNSPGVNPFTGDVDMLPVMWMSEGYVNLSSGWKGYSDFFQAILYNFSPGDTLNVSSSKDYAIWGGGSLAVPWNATDMNI